MLEKKLSFCWILAKIYGDHFGNYGEIAFLFEVFFSKKGLKIEICGVETVAYTAGLQMVLEPGRLVVRTR
jgi:hypothetical protein